MPVFEFLLIRAMSDEAAFPVREAREPLEEGRCF